jgi:pyruvate dehydrogenase E1 component alpha subunit
VARRADGYGMPGESVDGCDVFAVLDAARRAVARSRAGKGPTLLELKTYRWGGHFQGDPCKYRTREEEASWRARDPIARLKAQMEDMGFASVEEIDAAADAEIREAIEFALASPNPAPESALVGVLAA